MSKTLDLVTKLLLDNQDFDRNLKMSTQQVKAFQTVGKNVVGTLTKMAGTFGLAYGAAEVFNGIIRSSQETCDTFDGVVYAVKSSVEEFFRAINTGNFTAFNNGLDGIISRARKAYDAIDQLGNTIISYSLASSENNAKFNELMDKWRSEKDPKKKKEYYNQILGVIEDEKEITETLHDDINDKIDTQIKVEKPYFNGLSEKQYRQIIKADAYKDTRKAFREQALKDEEEFYDEKRKLEEDAKKREKTIGFSLYNKKTKKYETKWYNEEDEDAKKYIENGLHYKRRKDKKVADKLENDINELASQTKYQFAFAANKMLQSETDNSLTDAKDLIRQIDASNLNLSNMNRRLHAKDGSYKEEPKPTHDNIADDPYKDVKADMDTIAGTEKMINELSEKQKTANADDLAILGQKIKFLRTYLSLMQNGDIDKESQLILKEQYEKGDFEDEYEEVVEEVKIDPNSLEALQEQKSELIKKLNTSTNHDDYVKILAEISVVDEKMTDITEDKSGNERNKNLTKQAKLYNNLSRTIRGVGAAMQATGNQSKAMARSLAMVNAAASIAMMIAIMVEKLKTTKSPWEFIAAGLAGTAAVVSMAAQLRSINTAKYAEGGIVQSNNTIGDRNFVRVNGGEMILNNRQQRNLFTLLNGNVNGASNNTANVEFHISGRELVGVIDNYNNKMKRVK